jgi:hypothetical protein
MKRILLALCLPAIFLFISQGVYAQKINKKINKAYIDSVIKCCDPLYDSGGVRFVLVDYVVCERPRVPDIMQSDRIDLSRLDEIEKGIHKMNETIQSFTSDSILYIYYSPTRDLDPHTATRIEGIEYNILLLSKNSQTDSVKKELFKEVTEYVSKKNSPGMPSVIVNEKLLSEKKAISFIKTIAMKRIANIIFYKPNDFLLKNNFLVKCMGTKANQGIIKIWTKENILTKSIN